MDPEHPVDLTNEPDFLPPAWCAASYPGLSWERRVLDLTFFIRHHFGLTDCGFLCDGYRHADSDALLSVQRR